MSDVKKSWLVRANYIGEIMRDALGHTIVEIVRDNRGKIVRP